MKLLGCDIGFCGDSSSITQSSKIENMSNIFDIGNQEPLDSIFDCYQVSVTKLDVIETAQNIATGIIRLTLVNSDGSIIGEFAIMIHLLGDFFQYGKQISARMKSQTTTPNVWGEYKSSKSINGTAHHMKFEVANYDYQSGEDGDNNDEYNNDEDDKVLIWK